jgi:hypothetical protein
VKIQEFHASRPRRGREDVEGYGKLRPEPSALSSVVFLVLVFLGTLLIFERALRGLLLWNGLDSVHAELVIGDNELVLQILSLALTLTAWFCLVLRRPWTSLLAFVGPTYRAPGHRLSAHLPHVTSQLVSEAIRGWSRGLWATSLCVGVLVFFGVLKIETPLGLSSLVSSSLGFVQQAALLFFWLWGLARFRILLWTPLLEVGRGAKVAWILWVLFETHLYFRFVSGGLWLEFLPYSLPLLMLACLNTGIFTLGLKRDWQWQWRVALSLVGVWTALVAVYGFPLGASRMSSLFYVFPGPGWEWPQVSWDGLAPLALVGVLMFCANAVLLWESRARR